MEWVNTLLNLGFTPLNLILGGMLYLVLANQNVLPKFWQSKEEKEEEKVPLWAQDLKMYFNHDTTSHHEETHKKLDEVKDAVSETNRTLKEIKEYGIKCRKE